MRSRQGMTLVELGVAFAILALALLPVMNLFSGSGQQARQTSDFNQGITLGEKVAEDLRLANWENVHLSEDLATDPQAGASVSIVNGQSHWFDAIEDDRPPLGEILPGQDSGITPATASLFHQLETFKLFSKTTPRSLPTTGEVYDVNLSMSWTDFQRKTQELPLLVVLGDYGHWDAQPSLMQDRAGADDQIRQTFYPTKPGATLKEAVGPPPGNYDTAQRLGDTVLLVNALLNTEASYEANVRQLRSVVQTAAQPADQANAQVALARAEEARASAGLAVMIYLAPRLAALAASYDISQMGTPPPPPSSYFVPATHLTDIGDNLDRDLYWAESDYIQAYNVPMGTRLPPRVRSRLFFKIVDIHELRALTSGPTSLTGLQQFLTDFGRFQEGRNPNFASFARHELDDCKDLPTLQLKYRQPPRIDGYNTYQNNAYGASARILSGGAVTGGGAGGGPPVGPTSPPSGGGHGIGG